MIASRSVHVPDSHKGMRIPGRERKGWVIDNVAFSNITHTQKKFTLAHQLQLDFSFFKNLKFQELHCSWINQCPSTDLLPYGVDQQQIH